MFQEIVYYIYWGITTNTPPTILNMFAKYFTDLYTPQRNDRYDDENFKTISS